MNITGLIAGAQYVFRVFAVAKDNQTTGDSVSKTQYTSKCLICFDMGILMVFVFPANEYFDDIENNYIKSSGLELYW